MGSVVDNSTNLGEMRLHCMSVAIWHDQASAFTLCRTDGAEDVGPLGTLVVRSLRARATPGPSSGELVLLTYTGFVLPPQLNLNVLWEFRADPG